MRTDVDEKEFADWILEVGNGTSNVINDFGPDSFELPDAIVCESLIVDAIFGSI